MAVLRCRLFGVSLALIWISALSILQFFVPIAIEYRSFMFMASTIVMLVLGANYLSRRGIPKAALICECLALCLMFSSLVLISSYFAISVSRPLADGLLLSIDKSMGFDGIALVRTVDEQPAFALILQISYSSFAPQLLLLPLLLIVFGKAADGIGLVLSYAIAGMIGCILAIWFPAVGTGPAYGIDGLELNSISKHYFFAFMREFQEVRSEANFQLSLKQAQGIVTFPSLHAAVAVICCIACLRSRVLRYPVMMLNFLMLISTLTHGGHYLIDVVAGVVVAVTSLVLVSIVQGRSSPSKTFANQTWQA